MTLQQVCARLGKSENTVKSHFNRTAATLAKKGIILTKTGHGDKVDYQLEFPIVEGKDESQE